MIAACVHVSRRPSSNSPGRACQAAFEEANEEFTVASSRYDSLTTIRKGYEYLQGPFPGEVFALLAKEKPLCERARDFAEIEKDLKVKFDTVVQTSRILDEKEEQLSDLVQTDMMNDLEFERKALCVLNCGSSKNGKCSDFCGVNQKFIDQLASNELFMRLYNLCVPQTPEFQRWLEFYLPNWQKMLKLQLWPAYHELTLLAQSARLSLKEVSARLKAEKHMERLSACNVPIPGWKSSARTAVDLVKGPQKQGTAFYISVGDEVRVVTAEHIYNEFDLWSALEPKTLTFTTVSFRHTNRSQTTRELSPEAGLYNRGADIIQKRVTDRNAGLKLISSSALPEDGQNFYLVGYPKVKDYKYTVYRCTFYGYAISKVPTSSSMVYVLRCPGVDGHIAGMSGGPVLDESGKVWGLITDHNPFLARVYVSPMSITPEHEVRMAIQQTFMSNRCVSENEFEPHRCQVMPNNFGADTP